MSARLLVSHVQVGRGYRRAASCSDNGSRMNSANALTSKPPQFCTSFLLFRPSETTDLVQQQ